jgi:hypothetical protein
VTRDVEPSALNDLLEQAPRATVAFVDHGEVDLLPARSGSVNGTYQFGVSADVAPDLENREVVLVIDDGPYWFELRGISVRGVATRIDSQGQRSAHPLAWYAINARRVLAWDYGAIREE